MKIKLFYLVMILSILSGDCWAQEKKLWTLKDCINYALQNNISLQKINIQKQSSHEDLLQSQAALLPSLSANTSHNVAYTPWPETGRSTVANGYAVASIDKVYYNGSYGVNGNWTVWNGGRNTNTVKLNKLNEEVAELDSATTANQLQEQIAQLYVQILYSYEAIKVNEQTAETTRKNEERGKTMVDVGKMSKADLAQLTAQRAQAEFNIVDAKSNLRNYKRQLKQLLQITDEQEFDIAIPTTTDEMALQLVPALNEVYTSALATRPEIRNVMLGIETSDLNIKIAKAGKLPQVGVNAGFSTNTTSMSDKAWGTQLKSNVNLGAGVSVSIPLFDQRQTKSQVNKALLQKENYMLDLKDKKTALYSTIENYWLQAMNNQDKFKAAKISIESQQASFELLSEQFRLGLKNIIELMTGADNLRAAQQNELQSKYLAILNIEMLKFYRDGIIK